MRIRLLSRERGPLAAALAAGALALLFLAPSGARADQPSKALRILDACVYDLYFQQRSSEGVTRRCRCVVNRAGASISEREIGRYRVGSRLTGSLRRKIYEALQGCR